LTFYSVIIFIIAGTKPLELRSYTPFWIRIFLVLMFILILLPIRRMFKRNYRLVDMCLVQKWYGKSQQSVFLHAQCPCDVVMTPHGHLYGRIGLVVF